MLIATGIGGIATVEEQILVNAEKGARRVSPFLVPMMMPNAASATVSMRWGWQGPCQTVSTACAAGTHALVDAGDVDRQRALRRRWPPAAARPP